jgi:hypothetical protein
MIDVIEVSTKRWNSRGKSGSRVRTGERNGWTVDQAGYLGYKRQVREYSTIEYTTQSNDLELMKKEDKDGKG